MRGRRRAQLEPVCVPGGGSTVFASREKVLLLGRAVRGPTPEAETRTPRSINPTLTSAADISIYLPRRVEKNGPQPTGADVSSTLEVQPAAQPGTELDPLVGACELEAYPGEVMERRIGQGEFDPRGKRVQVLNPRGTPPAISLRPMAARPHSLDGRTIYLVDVRFMNGKAFLEEIQKVIAERMPNVRTVVRQKRGGYTEDDPELWQEIQANAALVVMAIGHCSTCAPAVAVHCMHLEERGIPTAPLVTGAFTDLVRAVSYKAGMPRLRFTFVPHPVSGKTPAQLRDYVGGPDPDSGDAVMDGIVRALTSPLTPGESERGQLERPVPRLLGADTDDALHEMFRDAWWSDGLPVVLPTAERVAAMLRGTKRAPDEVIGRMRPTQTQEDWSYTVEQVAVNAVMAGARPEHFPVILALAASQITAIHSSTSNFAAMVAVSYTHLTLPTKA